MSRVPPPEASPTGLPGMPASAPADEGDKTFSLMGGVARPEGLPEADELGLDAPRGGKRLGSGSLVLLALLVVGGASLYGMRATQATLASEQNLDAQTKIEQYLAKLTQPQALAPNDPLAPGNMSALFQDTDAIVAMLSEDPTRRQLPIDYVQKNPFVLPVLQPVAVAGHAPAAPARPKVDLAKKRLEEELRGLRLTSVMGGQRTAAIVSGQVVQVGQTLGSFTVKSINPPLSLELEHEGQAYTLTMEAGRR